MDMASTKEAAVGDANAPTFQTALPAEIVDLIEAVGAMQNEAEATAKRIKTLQASLKPYTERLKRLADLMTDYAAERGINPDKEFTEHANGVLVLVGKATSSRTVVDVQRVMKIMGKKLFFEKCSISLGVVDQYLTPEEKMKVIRTDRCARSIKIVTRK